MNKLFFLLVLILSTNLSVAQITYENDSLFFRQKEIFEKMNVFEAWKTTRGNPEVLIGCIDIGFDFYHPYLRDRLLPGYYAEGVYHTESYQTIAHGTLVSSLMVANPQNENGMWGLAPECKVLTASLGTIEHPFMRLMNEIKKNNPGMSDADVVKKTGEKINKDTLSAQQLVKPWVNFVIRSTSNAIVYLVKNGVKVINMSMYTFKSEFNEAFEFARKHDVLVVIGAGNGSKEIPQTLQNRDNVIVVGASTKNDTRWEVTTGGITQGSNWGEDLDVCATSEDIAVCQPADPRFYKIKDGPTGAENISYKGISQILRYGATSSATPIVTSLAALVYSIAPDMTANEVKQVIIDGCDDIEEEGFDIYTGYGRINFGKTLYLVSDRKEKP